VLNGIAFDDSTGHFFLTGKLWPKLFEVRFDFDPYGDGRQQDGGVDAAPDAAGAGGTSGAPNDASGPADANATGGGVGLGGAGGSGVAGTASGASNSTGGNAAPPREIPAADSSCACRFPASPADGGSLLVAALLFALRLRRRAAAG